MSDRIMSLCSGGSLKVTPCKVPLVCLGIGIWHMVYYNI